MENIQALRGTAGELQRELDKLAGMQQQLIGKKAEKLIELEASTAYLDSSEEVLGALTEVHNLAQQKSKALYENLLTTQLRELMPHNKECERVVLNNFIRKARPALSIEVETSNGHMRNIYEDKGGSIESVVAVGLRFICLSRTANRRFLVFDEADAGLSERYMPQFATMLEQLATQIGVQVIYITHKPSHMFEGKGRVIELQSRKGMIHTDIVSDYKFSGKTEGVNDEFAGDFFEDTGIEYIRIVNGKQHENTKIELCPYVNYIIGDNDIGKTSVTQMIEAVAQNKGRDGLIRDGENYCAVELGLEGEMTLEYRYNRTGAKKTSYKLFDSDGNVVQHSDSGTKKPEWLDEYLAMPLVNNIDIHISDQHNASFILDKKYSEHQRAEMLNIDDDAAITQKMIARHTEITGYHKSKCRTLKSEIANIKSTLDKIRAIEVAQEELTIVLKELDEANNFEMKSTSLNNIIGEMTRLEGTTSSLRKLSTLELPKLEELSAMSEVRLSATALIDSDKKVNHLQSVSNLVIPEVEQLSSTADIGIIADQIDTIEKRANTVRVISNIELPNAGEIQDGKEIIEAGVKIGKSLAMITKLKAVSELSAPKVSNIYEMQNIRAMGAQMVNASTKCNKLNGDIGDKTLKLNQSKQAIETALEGMDYCPLCKTVKHKTQECA